MACTFCRDSLADLVDTDFYPSEACEECYNDCGTTYRPEHWSMEAFF